MIEITNVFDRPVLVSDDFTATAVFASLSIIHQCDCWEPDGRRKDIPCRGVMSNDDLKADAFECVDLLQSQAEIVYAFQKAYIAGVRTSKTHLLTRDEAILMTKALSTFQDWKEQMSYKMRKIEGRDWSSEAVFYKTMWDENNGKFFEAFERRK